MPDPIAGFFRSASRQAPAVLPQEIAICADRLVEAFGRMMATPAFHEEAQRLNLPLHPLTGTAYRQFVLAEAAAIKTLFARRPWGGR